MASRREECTYHGLSANRAAIVLGPSRKIDGNWSDLGNNTQYASPDPPDTS
jgi:hypothetical protein